MTGRVAVSVLIVHCGYMQVVLATGSSDDKDPQSSKRCHRMLKQLPVLDLYMYS